MIVLRVFGSGKNKSSRIEAAICQFFYPGCAYINNEEKSSPELLIFDSINKQKKRAAGKK